MFKVRYTQFDGKEIEVEFSIEFIADDFVKELSRNKFILKVEKVVV